MSVCGIIFLFIFFLRWNKMKVAPQLGLVDFKVHEISPALQWVWGTFKQKKADFVWIWTNWCFFGRNNRKHITLFFCLFPHTVWFCLVSLQARFKLASHTVSFWFLCCSFIGIWDWKQIQWMQTQASQNIFSLPVQPCLKAQVIEFYTATILS